MLTAGTISLVSAQSTTASLVVTAASGGSGPYTNQWYRSTTSGFSPGGGNILTGKTALTLSDSGLIPNTVYYYKVVQVDTGHSNDEVTATQLAVTTVNGTSQNQNQFGQSPILGMIDLRFDYDTISAEVDSSQTGYLYAGSLVKIVDSADGVPKVIGITANSDNVFGVINYDIKSQSFIAGSKVELSQAGNVIYLYASGAIARGAKVTPTFVNPGSVQTANSGDNIIGWAYDKATAYGQLIRVKLISPSFLTQ